MVGKAKSEKKGNSTLYNKQWRKKNRKQKRTIERIPKVLWKFTTNKTNRKPTAKKNRTRDKHKISKSHRW